jgi:hypothetical protein
MLPEVFGHIELGYPSIDATECGKAGQMTKLRSPRWLARCAAPMALVLIFALPTGALAETPAESEAPPPTEASPPVSPGWVPPGEAAEDTGGATAPIGRGSSLGSGGGSSQPPPADQEPVSSEAPAPAPVSSGTSEPEAPSQPLDEEPASAPEPAPAVGPEPRVAKPDPVALGVAVPVATASKPEPRSAPPVEAKPVANRSEPAASGSSVLLWPALIVGILIFLYAGARLLLGPVELDLFRSSLFRRARRGYPRF